MKKRTVMAACAGVCSVLVLLGGFTLWRNTRVETNTGFAMGTAIVQRLIGGDAAGTARQILSKIQSLETAGISWRAPGSEIAKINAAGGKPVELCAETAELLKTITEISAKSGGALDCTVGTLTRLWDFESASPRAPADADIARTLKTVGYQNLLVDGGTVTLNNAAQLDLGAVGKGLACDKARELLENSRVSNGTVSVGGSVLVWSKSGAKEQTVGIRNPLGRFNDALGVLTLTDSAVSTSGSYERYFDLGGVRYHHLLNPATGMPAETGLMSVTIVSDSGLISDALSTACFVLGYEKSQSLLDGYGAKAVFVFSDKTIRVSSGLSFTLTNDAYRVLSA